MTSPLLPPSSSVAVIGGGSVGIVAAKELLAAGLTPTVFEQSPSVGGVWTRHWDSLVTNSSRTLMSLSDFPADAHMPATTPVFPTKADVVHYMTAYAKHFHLFPHIHFSTTVVAVRRRARDGKWDVTTSPATHSGVFDAVVVATGQFNTPSMPELPLYRFTAGPVLHSSAYKNANGVAGKRVLVVGIGNSALDIALEVAEADPPPASVTVAVRSRSAILPVSSDGGQPRDVQLLSRAFEYWLPSIGKKAVFAWLMSKVKADFDAAGMPPDDGTQPLRQRISNLKRHASWVSRLRAGDVSFVPHVTDVGSDSVTLADGQTLGVDMIVCCTGYKLEWPFLDELVVRSATVRFDATSKSGAVRRVTATALRRRIMHPKHSTLCFLGLVSTLGNEAAVGELQARWAAAALTGRLVSGAVGDDDIQAQRDKLLASRTLYPLFVKYVTYMDTLATDLGVRPDWWRYALTQPSTAWQLAFGPVRPSQFRLIDPPRSKL